MAATSVGSMRWCRLDLLRVGLSACDPKRTLIGEPGILILRPA